MDPIFIILLVPKIAKAIQKAHTELAEADDKEV